MESKDLNTLAAIRNAITNPASCEDVAKSIIKNPAKEVEASLVSFLQHKLGKLQEATAYEDTIKDLILTRVAEATFPQLMGLLEIIQKNNNIATEKLLAPFIAQNGNRTVTETMKEDAKQNSEASATEVYSSTDDKKVLQSLSALSQFLEAVKQKSSTDCTDGNISP